MEKNFILKSGILGAEIYIFTLILVRFLLLNSPDDKQDLILRITLFTGQAYPILTSFLFTTTHNEYVSFIGLVLIFTLIYFMIGATIGKLIEILKRKNSIKDNGNMH
ncbi:MAG: hypothetical protein RBS56_00550 [Candidatus Gracilibacteria bacterium]|jgi:CDP-diglyceride synthetase|nr:hypothetical protein [Candidatus Gracilibacteria bacterium]